MRKKKFQSHPQEKKILKGLSRNLERPSAGKKIYKGLFEEKKIVKRSSAGKKNLERLSRGKNKFIFEFSSAPPQIING